MQKLNTVIPYDQEKVPDITRLLDSIHTMLDQIKLWSVLRNPKARKTVNDPTWVISRIVAYNYYDCMSGGMPIYLIALVRYLMKTYTSIDWDAYVYPSSPDSDKEHYTLRDFYEETQKHGYPDIMPQVKDFPVSY